MLSTAVFEVNKSSFVVCLALSALLPAAAPSPSQLIDLLTHRLRGPEAVAAEMGIFSCGQQTPYRNAVAQFTALGPAAIPALEAELRAIAAAPPRSSWGLSYLATAYAQIQGPAALPLLRRVAAASGENIDDALAIAHGVTSYVSPSRTAVRRFLCNRAPEPRDALDLRLVELAHSAPHFPGLAYRLQPRGKESPHEFEAAFLTPAGAECARQRITFAPAPSAPAGRLVIVAPANHGPLEGCGFLAHEQSVRSKGLGPLP